MNIEFTSAHMQTLCELKEMADKHGCKITFGVTQSYGFVGFEKFIDYSEDILDELNDLGYFDSDVERGDHITFWFQLYDPNSKTTKYNTLQYGTGWQATEYRFYETLDDDTDISEKTRAFLEDNVADWSSIYADTVTLYSSFGETKITGFEGQTSPEVYREGMALKFFGDLVCDYLGEERIDRVY